MHVCAHFYMRPFIKMYSVLGTSVVYKAGI